MTYLERLAARIEDVGNCLCVGVDPTPDSLPAHYSRDITGVERFATSIVEAALPRAAALKINVAFFEAFGSAGIGVLERLRARVPSDLPLILDAKRGDIATTAERQSVALFDALGADAVTANPYLGADALQPFLQRHDRFTYVLCRTSNPGAGEIQNLDVAGEPLYVHVARRAAAWAPADNLGLVVGATAPTELDAVRTAVPQLPFLVPGIGAQGGELASVLRHGPATAGVAGGQRGGALLVNVSRGIASAALSATSEDEIDRLLGEAVVTWAQQLQC